MRAGRLKRRVTLQNRTVSTDASGGSTSTWAAIDTVYAAVEPLRGREYFEAAANQAEVDTRIVIRFRDDITLNPDDRVLWGSRTFDIQSIIDVMGGRLELHLMCKEYVQ